MSTQFPTCQVMVWGQTVGFLADTGHGQIAFEYDDAFLRSGLELSPLKMPLRAGQVYVNSDDPQAFDGLPGVFADSLPDLYGKKVVQKYFEAKYPGRNHFTSIVQHLMYIGSRGMGALEYQPAEDTGLNSREALEVAFLVEQARRVVQGDINTQIGAIMQSYATAGGQRPKAVIAWNRQTSEIRAGNPPIPEGFENWIIKFDGAEAAPQDYGRIEHAYARMAASAGITVPETELIVENGRAHFLTRRFDNNDGQRLHMHSLGGLMHADYNKPRLVDYTEFLAVVMALTKDHSQVDEGFRRMAFNVIARNQDDHVKNIAFLMDSAGRWRLSPAFDLIYANGHGWTSQHQMTVAGVSHEPTDADMLRVAAAHGVKKAGEIIEQVREAVSHWPDYAEASGVSDEWTETIQAELRAGQNTMALKG